MRLILAAALLAATPAVAQSLPEPVREMVEAAAETGDKAKIEAVKRGDQVITGGGLIGKVTKVEDNIVELELAPGMKVRALKSTLTDSADTLGAKPAND